MTISDRDKESELGTEFERILIFYELLGSCQGKRSRSWRDFLHAKCQQVVCVPRTREATRLVFCMYYPIV